MIFVIVGIGVSYFILIASFSFGFGRIKTFTHSQRKPTTRFSVIIPFRNEEHMLPALLESISTLNYPKDYFEFIFVDDDSEDASVEVIHAMIKQFSLTASQFSLIKNIRTSNSPKKDAITLAISVAKHEWVVTTDADCLLPKYWLDSFDEFIQTHHPHLIVAPLTYTESQGFLQNFQLMDVLSLQGATIGGFGINKPFLCNGANLAYKKSLFKSLNGFVGNSDIASGDDIFILEKALELEVSKVHYLKDRAAMVSTFALTSWSDLIDQRVRWAAKSSAYKNWFGQVVGLIVFSQNTLLAVGILLLPTGIFAPKHLAINLLMKLSIDFLLIYKTAKFFQQKNHLKFYLLSAFCYPFFSVMVVFLAVFKSFKWKNRSYRK